MAQINFRIDDQVKRDAESLFNSLGMNTTTALMIFIRQSLTERAIPFAVSQTPVLCNNRNELTRRIEDLSAGRNCHVHELINAEDSTPSTPRRRMRHAKTLA